MVPTSTIDASMKLTLRLIGIWPESSFKFLQRVVWAMTMVIFQLFQYWHLFIRIGSSRADIGNQLPDLLDGMSVCLSNSLLFLKMSILWLNRRIVYDIFATMAEDLNECASTYSKTQAMTNKAILSHRISKFTITVYATCIVLFAADFMFVQRSADSEQPVQERQLIVKMELPFEYSASPLYEIITITQFILQFIITLVAGMLNAFIATLVLHIAGQIDIMCHELLEIPVVEDKRNSRIVALRAIVNRHQRIIAFVDNIEDAFSYMALLQFFSNTFVICFLGLVIVVLLDSGDENAVLMRMISYYAIMILEAFVLCFTGEYLNSKSKSINQAVYDSFWYELKPTEGKILLLLIVRSQRLLTITVGKFMNLSLESFTSILKASASYVSVLHAMY